MPARLAIAALAALFTLTACSRDEVRSYRIPKEASPQMPGAAAAASASPAAGSAAFTWQAPEGWVDQGPSGMRRGSFQVPGENGETAPEDSPPISTAGAAKSACRPCRLLRSMPALSIRIRPISTSIWSR